jgi:hypothetical protein
VPRALTGVRAERVEECLPTEPVGAHTPQVPPKPIVTRSPSTITGTLRLPPEYWSMRWNADSSFWTLKYRTSYPRWP